MKLKYIILIFIIGIILIGALFKILRWIYGSELLTIGTFLQIIAFLLFIIKLFTDKKFKNLLNQ